MRLVRSCSDGRYPPRKRLAYPGRRGAILARDGDSDYVGFHIHKVATGIFEIDIGTGDLNEIFLRAPAVGLAAFGVGERRASLANPSPEKWRRMGATGPSTETGQVKLTNVLVV
jgi:hypothetical protein